MTEFQLPTYYEVRLPDGKTGFKHLDEVLRDPKLRGEVVASLRQQAELSELKAVEQRAITQKLVQLAEDAGAAGQ